MSKARSGLLKRGGIRHTAACTSCCIADMLYRMSLVIDSGNFPELKQDKTGDKLAY